MKMFNGWTRLPGQSWQAVVTGSDEDTAWRLLRQHVEQLGARFVDTYVGPADADPRSRRLPASQSREVVPVPNTDPFACVLDAAGLPTPIREHRFAPPRRWRFDYCWPSLRLALEVEGGTWTGGRHVRGQGYERDCEKYNAAALAGWKVLRVTTGMVSDGRALSLLEQAFSNN
jgi:hypothetical protein